MIRISSFLWCLTVIYLFGTLSSCSIEKRRYNKGFSINWIGSNSAKQNKLLKVSDSSLVNQSSNEFAEADLVSNTPELTQQDDGRWFDINIAQHDTVSPRNHRHLSPAESVRRFDHKASKVIEVRIPPLTINHKSSIDTTAYEDQKSRLEGQAIFSFIAGMSGLVLFATGLGLIAILLFIMAIVFGINGLIKINRQPDLRGKGFAIAGLVAAALGILFIIIALIMFFAFFVAIL